MVNRHSPWKETDRSCVVVISETILTFPDRVVIIVSGYGVVELTWHMILRTWLNDHRPSKTAVASCTLSGAFISIFTCRFKLKLHRLST